MSNHTFRVGDRVRWADLEYTIWALHPKRGFVWLTRDGKTVAARTANLELIAATPSGERVQPLEVAKPRTRLASIDRKVIEDAIRADALAHDGQISINRVRAALSNEDGLTVSARRLSATYSALAHLGLIRSRGWTDTNDDVRGGNAGRPARAWEWVGEGVA